MTGGNASALLPGHPVLGRLAQQSTETWLSLGNLSLALGRPLEAALACFEAALERAPYSQPALEALAAAYSTAEDYPRAAEIYQRLLHLSPSAGSLWGSLGHCALMMDDLQRAYAAYQQALYHLPDPKEPKLWYGIGILYDRYGSLEHAEEAFSSVLRMDPAFEKSNEIYFRLGIIYKTQGSLDKALECFSYILHTPPTPLSRWDILFQIGHVYESQRDFEKAKETFEKVLEECPIHGKVLQQLGWLYQDSRASFHSLDSAAALLSKSIEVDSKDAQTWYLLGRVAMAQQKYTDAYESYQQAVYRDGRNPTFWCSIGVLYYQLNQFTDALDAYGRAIRLNPYISEVWYDLGTLYESCNNQVADAMDAYARALELDPGNAQIQARLQVLKSGGQGGARPGPTGSIPPSATASAPPPSGTGKTNGNTNTTTSHAHAHGGDGQNKLASIQVSSSASGPGPDAMRSSPAAPIPSPHPQSLPPSSQPQSGSGESHKRALSTTDAGDLASKKAKPSEDPAMDTS